VTRTRWPAWVYAEGEEPDYRFSFANERTFLAWIRTALALIAGGVALDAFDLDVSSGLQHGVAAAVVVLGLGCAVAAWWRWAVAERAMRRRQPLPAQGFGAVLAAAVVLAAVALLVAVL
jgi:putative membrane protein